MGKYDYKVGKCGYVIDKKPLFRYRHGNYFVSERGEEAFKRGEAPFTFFLNDVELVCAGCHHVQYYIGNVLILKYIPFYKPKSELNNNFGENKELIELNRLLG